jgi:protein-disulfide isomerase
VRRSAILLLSLALAAAARAQEKCDNCSVPSLSAPEKRNVEQPQSDDLKKLDADLDSLWLRGDKAALAAALADGMISVDPHGGITQKEKLLARVAPANPARKMSISADDALVMLLGDTAIVTSKKTRKWEARGHPEVREYRETNTYVRRGGRWLLIASQDSEGPPPYSAKDVAFDLPFDPAQALGDKNATVVLYEFSDYQCPFCRRFAAETLSRVQKEYVRTGRAALVFRDNPLEDLHPRAFAAATAAQCASPAGKFWEMNERLLRDPPELSDEALARDARELGIESAQFERCVNDPATAQRIRAGMKEAEGYGIRGTPIFVVGVRRPGDSTVRSLRMIEGAFPYEVFQTTLEGVIRSQKP